MTWRNQTQMKGIAQIDKNAQLLERRQLANVRSQRSTQLILEQLSNDSTELRDAINTTHDSRTIS